MAALPAISRIVASSSVVFPAPGELIRLTARIPRSASHARLACGEVVVLGQHLLLQLDGPLPVGRLQRADLPGGRVAGAGMCVLRGHVLRVQVLRVRRLWMRRLRVRVIRMIVAGVRVARMPVLGVPVVPAQLVSMLGHEQLDNPARGATAGRAHMLIPPEPT